jgi:uncharacterized membrane protein
VAILARVGDDGLAVIRSMYPEQAGRDEDETAEEASAFIEPPARIVPHTGRSGIVLSLDIEGLVALARQHDGRIEFLPQVGDFVAADEPLFVLRGAAAMIGDEVLRAAVTWGSERTLEQDPAFPFRILVDIALKALSPAINDPTTAILAIDQVHRLLRIVGRCWLRGEVVADVAGAPRVLLRTPNWEDFIHLACHEIRMCGANNMQVARRLRAMLVNLMAALAAHRHEALLQELDLLDRTVAQHFSLPEDLALARIADVQGLGGASVSRRNAAAR